MRKFLVIFLIAIVACAEINIFDQTEVELESKVGDFLKRIAGKAIEVAKKVKKWLKDNGLWDPLVKMLKSLGKMAAQSFCEKHADPGNCRDLINNIDAAGEIVLKGVDWVKIAEIGIPIAYDIAKEVYHHFHR